ncbi:uncharacterized protein BcabD6B2_18570 [Babesia caballi]|uniref:Uncharacterized protein n=1 Tax=Babesia caballi TaxID=5871 RepID=A0AAV4LQ93_BABCB|nr:hypothetical protein, conserved [Babesia caballi]
MCKYAIIESAGGGVRGELDGKELHHVVVEDAAGLGVVEAALEVGADAGAARAAVVGGVELGDDHGGVVAGVGGQHLGDHLEGLGELARRVLLETGEGLGELGQLPRHLDFEGAAPGEVAGVADGGGDAAQGVVDGALDLVQHALGGALEDDGRQAVLDRLEDDGLLRRNVHHLDGLGHAQVVLAGHGELHHGGGAESAAEPAELELGGDLHHHYAHGVAVVQRQLGDGAVCDHAADALVLDRPDHGLHLGLLALAEVQQLLGGVEEHSALGLGAGELEAAGDHEDLGAGELLDDAADVTHDGHAVHYRGLVEAAAADLDDADVVDVEVLGVGGDDGGAGLGDEGGDELGARNVLAGDAGADHGGQLGLVADVGHLPDDLLLHQLEQALVGQLVAEADVRDVESLVQQKRGLRNVKLSLRAVVAAPRPVA